MAVLVAISIGCNAPARAENLGTVSNTASLHYQLAGSDQSITSNSVSFDIQPAQFAAHVQFLHYASGSNATQTMPVAGTQCKTASGAFVATSLPKIGTSASADQDLTAIPLFPARAYHAGDVVFLSLSDPSRNLNATQRETVDMIVRTSVGDEETLRLVETGPDTGIFAGAVATQSTATAIVPNNCILSVSDGTMLQADYQNTSAPSDQAHADILVDPLGRVFNSATGDPVNGATITLINDATGAQATVLGDDAASAYPATVTSGGSATDASGTLYQFPAGGFRFPLVAPANYHFVITPPGGFTAPSIVPVTVLKSVQSPTGELYLVKPGSLGDLFNVDGTEIVKIDVPVDPIPSSLVLDKQVSTPTASAGDYLQYHLKLQNRNPGAVAQHAVISDVLPSGLHYTPGSLRINNLKTIDPAISGDGARLSIPLGSIAANSTLDVTYVAQVGSNAPIGDAINTATVFSKGGLQSNASKVATRIVAAFFNDQMSILGRVMLGPCDAPTRRMKGIANIRMLLDDGTYVVTDVNGQFHFENIRPGTHVVQLDDVSLPASLDVAQCHSTSRSAGRGFSQFVEGNGGSAWRADFYLKPRDSAAGPAIPSLEVPEAVDDVTAGGGGKVDWFAQAPAGNGIVFPAASHNPRAPVSRVVVRYAAGQHITLSVNGKTLDALAFDGTQTNADSSIAVSVWRGVPLVDGANLIDAELRNDTTQTNEHYRRTIFYTNTPAHAELIQARSQVLADGLHKPTLAVRFTDRDGHPVRTGVSGSFHVSAPYVPASRIDLEQSRQLAGLDRLEPTYRVSDDNGTAYIELAPTTTAGQVAIDFDFNGDLSKRHQTIRTWLQAAPRDWVVVGFASGTLGFETLRSKALPVGRDTSTYTDGSISLYAKGKVLGKWLLTLAYDSDKQKNPNRDRSLGGVIDPNRLYTLYGDRAEQRSDAASQYKLYLKLERQQYYGLFGDYETALNQSQLMRYNRSLSGLKGEYHGKAMHANWFAAETNLNHQRDEIQANGLSGPYRLSRSDIILNSERVMVETRDRLRSERIVSTQVLQRYVDYTLDANAGTITFRQPLLSHDINFNPNFIVADYETANAASKQLNYGGRTGVELHGGRIIAGATFIHDDNGATQTNLGGFDARLKLTPQTEIRLEAAHSVKSGTVSASVIPQAGGITKTTGSDTAYIAEIEQQSGHFDALAYLRYQGSNFGISQQNGSESGTRKFGFDARYDFNQTMRGLASFSHQHLLQTGLTEIAGSTQLEYHTNNTSLRAGMQVANDEQVDGVTRSSQQFVVAGSQFLLHHKLELSAESDFGLDNNHTSAINYPSRYRVGAAYAVRDGVRLIANEELSHGQQYDSRTTQFGIEVDPWRGGHLTSTLNQNAIQESGPRTFAQFGLMQSFVLDAHWGVDVAFDSNKTLHQRVGTIAAINPLQPIASGGQLAIGTLTDNFWALSTGATYRAPLWSWNGKLEVRQGGSDNRYGVVTALLRQISNGTAVSLSANVQRADQKIGTKTTVATVAAGIAIRPSGSGWSLLDKLELHVDAVKGGLGTSLATPLGSTTLNIFGDAASQRLVNNLVVNHVSSSEQQGRTEWSVFYGAKYVFTQFDHIDYKGYTDVLGVEVRRDIGHQLDVGFHADVRHAWSAHDISYAYGPTLGVSPFTNAWFSLGYNVKGYSDRDFSAAHHSQQGPFISLRYKFDQLTAKRLLGG